jgi:hypothetical protein
MAHKSKEDRTAYRKDYYEKNKEKIKARVKAYSEANIGKINERRKKAYDLDRGAHLARQAAYRAADKEGVKARHRAYYAKNKEKYAAYAKKVANSPGMKRRTLKYRLRKTYGLEVMELALLQELQGHACGVCGCQDPALHIDHNHTTGVVRGLLCRSCNMVEGYINKMNIQPKEFAQRLQAYLDNPPFQQMKEKESAA